MPLAPDKLTEDEFEDVVEEIAKKQADAAEGVSHDDARKALQELDLPADKLDEATATVRQRREAELRAAAKKKRLVLFGVGALALLLTLGAAVGMLKQAQVGKVARITAADTTLAEEGGQLRLSTKLMNAPKGDALPMTCAWRAPDGTLLHENAWQTKPISHDAWETHCVFQKAPEHVKVTMKASDRVIAESSR